MRSVAPAPEHTVPEPRSSTAEPEERVVLEELPSQPREVQLDYPDGTRLTAGTTYGGRHERHHRWIAAVPECAKLANGMVIRVDRETVVAVAVTDREPRWNTQAPRS